MRTLIVLLLTLSFSSVFAQDFKFRGKSEHTEHHYFTLGNEKPDNSEELKKKIAISFDGQQLLIGKKTYKYLWHQLSRNDDTIQLNCIERKDEGEFPYIDAKFEIDFISDLEINLQQFISTSATTYTKVIYSIKVIKTTK